MPSSLLHRATWKSLQNFVLLVLIWLPLGGSQGIEYKSAAESFNSMLPPATIDVLALVSCKFVMGILPINERMQESTCLLSHHPCPSRVDRDPTQRHRDGVLRHQTRRLPRSQLAKRSWAWVCVCLLRGAQGWGWRAHSLRSQLAAGYSTGMQVVSLLAGALLRSKSLGARQQVAWTQAVEVRRGPWPGTVLVAAALAAEGQRGQVHLAETTLPLQASMPSLQRDRWRLILQQQDPIGYEAGPAWR